MYLLKKIIRIKIPIKEKMITNIIITRVFFYIKKAVYFSETNSGRAWARQP